MISATFPIAPVAKGRPRLGRHGVYTPAKTVRFEQSLQALAQKVHPKGVLTGALKLTLRFVMKAPAKRRAHPTVRPDVDNLIKSVSDALNGIFWVDDSQIVEVHACKVYDYVNKNERIELKLEEVA